MHSFTVILRPDSIRVIIENMYNLFSQFPSQYFAYHHGSTLFARSCPESRCFPAINALTTRSVGFAGNGNFSVFSRHVYHILIVHSGATGIPLLPRGSLLELPWVGIFQELWEGHHDDNDGNDDDDGPWWVVITTAVWPGGDPVDERSIWIVNYAHT